MTKFSPTPQQSAIREFVLNGKGSALVSALAGSAKTTTIKYAAESVTTPAIAVAFNKKIQEDLKAALPQHFEVLTFNSAGHSAWGRYIGKKLNLDARKTYKVTTILGQGEIRRVVMRLIDCARSLGLVPDGKLPGKPCKVFLPDTPASWHEVQALAGIEELPTEDDCISLARDFLIDSIKLAFEGQIDFNDQVYMSCCFGGIWKTAQLVFVDEAQDLSALNHYMLRRMTLRRVIAVGDEHQAIYAFRGASSRSMSDLAEMFKAERLSLTTCFRCSVAVVKEAQAYTPHMEPAPWAPVGSVTRLDEWTLDDIEPDSAVLCRNNSPLFALGFAFLAAGRPVNFHGKDLGWQIEKEIKSLAGENNIFKTALIELLDAKILRTDEDLRERLFDIRDIIEAIPGEDTDAVSANLNALLSAPSGDVTLSSIHGSKGLEWEKVYFLDRWRIPSKYAKTEEQLKQEFNLAYVGVTRAKLDLVYVDLDGLLLASGLTIGETREQKRMEEAQRMSKDAAIAQVREMTMYDGDGPDWG